MGSEPEKPDDEPATVFMPSRPPTTGAPLATDAPSATDAPAAASQPPPSATTPPAGASVGVHGQVEIGDVLNGIYEVKRLIGRGGMGEVYEGANINSDERVAIKVMLPALAADPNVQAMFRKEARTLTRLAHPAVVQYRVLAQEPRLNILYIVTEFIDGEALSDVLGRIHPSPAELRSLTRRLAEGLRAAHELGAVHRDMSPDNVLLPDGRLDRAKIIDFGIAKDLDPSKATIVGDGFAGKLGYVAPEQFGDFGREVGPWTDVYSLGLVILAVAEGRNVDMGSTLVEAVDKRRAGVDLSPIPPDLRPVLEKMLTADPAKRLRSMDEVLTALEGGHHAVASPQSPPDGPQPPAGGAKPSEPPRRQGLPLPLMLGAGAAVVVVVIGVVAFLALPKGQHKPSPAVNAPAQTASTLPDAARQAIAAALPSVSCAWLDLVNPDPSEPASVKLVGVAGAPAEAEAAVVQAAKTAGVSVSDVDLDDVAPADQTVCPPLDAFRSIRAPTPAAGARLSSAQRTYLIVKQPNGKMASRAVITMALRDKSVDFALLGLEPSGKISMIVPSRQAFDAARASNNLITDMGGDIYRLQIDSFDFQGWSGLLLLTGKGPFDQTLLAAPPQARGADWPGRVSQAAAAGGWKADMVWYRVENGTADSGAEFSLQRKARASAAAHRPGQPHPYSPGPTTSTAQTTASGGSTASSPPTTTTAPAEAKPSFWKRLFGSGKPSSPAGAPSN